MDDDGAHEGAGEGVPDLDVTILAANVHALLAGSEGEDGAVAVVEGVHKLRVGGALP